MNACIESSFRPLAQAVPVCFQPIDLDFRIDFIQSGVNEVSVIFQKSAGPERSPSNRRPVAQYLNIAEVFQHQAFIKIGLSEIDRRVEYQEI
ncbi:MAG TPA: hypothetical protein VLQ89_00600, partial [Candidatus Binatia bacterium]|nr:hypothetical protein [Candidatus Binatia bacterium]